MGEKRNYNLIIYRESKMWITCFFLFFFISQLMSQDSFLNKQLTFSRVIDAFNSSLPRLKEEFEFKNLPWQPTHIFIRAFKQESELEIWVLNNGKYELFKSYSICAKSGGLGPKTKQGDKQVPEGLYYIDRFNPSSSFWLSLGINYPNEADLIRTTAADPGGDIFIHGDCVTVGCLPMTDNVIKEIYVLSVLARNNGQEQIPVYIYPYKFSVLNNVIYSFFKNDNDALWNNLEEDYDYFEEHKRLRNYYVNNSGLYIFYE